MASQINKDSFRVSEKQIMNNSAQKIGNVGHDVQIIQNRQSSKGIDIVFKDISYTVEVDSNEKGSSQKITKTLLNKLTGICKAGSVTALMGTSGAGKTTLLNVFACRISATEGELLANNRPYNYQTFGDFANYVMQKDVLMQTLTVKQTLQFVANLKLNKSKEEIEERITQISKSMKLQKCMDVLVGGRFVKGISGGEKKRTSIAVELISDPQVIMLDEPTSGLDSLTSFIIVDYLSELAHKQNKTVLMTIHQPNSEIFSKFDKLLLMAEGSLVYQGPAKLGIQYFATKLNKAIPEFMNPAQFFIQEMHQQKKENVEILPHYFDCYRKNILPQILIEIRGTSEQEFLQRSSDISYSTSFGQLLKRDLINTIRNPMILKSKIFQSIFLALYTGGLYFNSGNGDYTNNITWSTMSGYFFFLSIACVMGSLSPVALVFPSEREVFLKEENSRLYGVVAYFLSRNFIEIPYLIFLPLIFILIIYWMVGQASTAEQFFIFYLICFVTNFSGSSLGLFIGSILRDQKSNQVVTPLIMLPLFVFAGVFKNFANFPDWVGWIQYISPLKYCFISMLVNETNNKPSMIDQLNFDLEMWPSIFALIGLSIGLRLLALFFLWLLKTKIQ